MDTVASDSKNLMEHNVTIEYEGVYFGKGRVTRFNPSGWTDLHYDLDPSPIGGIFGRGDGGLLGPNGLIQDGIDLFSDLQGIENSPNVDSRQALAVLIKSARLISNAYNLDYGLSKQQLEAATIRNIGFTVEQATGSVNGLSIIKPNNSSTTSATVRNGVTSQTSFEPTSSSNTTPDGTTNSVVKGP
jgi:hypothetical protein